MKEKWYMRLISSGLERKTVFLLVMMVAMIALAVQFYLIESELFTPLSPVLRLPGYTSGLLNEYIPLSLTIYVLIWIKMRRLGGDRKEKMSLAMSVLTLVSSVLAIIILLRLVDMSVMIAYADIRSPQETLDAMIWVHFIFYCLFSLILFGASALFFGLKGFKTLFTTSIIPAFYTLNADLIMRADRFPVLGVLYPFYLLILAFGRFETIAVGGLLNLLGMNAKVYADTFPYRIIVGNSIYLVDMPCIGWEGVMGYTIIFLNLMVEIEKKNKMRVLWGFIGFIGTLFVNLLRLVLIFVVGAVWGVSSAEMIHSRSGDLIFVLWILVFFFIITRLQKRV